MEVEAIWPEWRRALAAFVGAVLCLSYLSAPASAVSNLDQMDLAASKSSESVLLGIATRMSRRLQTIEGAPTLVAFSPQALDLVVPSIPPVMALVQRDFFSARDNALDHTKLEVYGRIPACVLVLGRPGWSPGLDNARSIDVGSQQGWTAETIKILSGIEPILASSRIEYRGGARALDRVRNGEDDIAFLMVYDDVLDPVTLGFLKDGLLAPLPLFSASHLREASKAGLNYQSGQITVPVAHSWWRQTRFETICTTLGVAVNTSTEVRFVEIALESLSSGPLDEAKAKIEKLWENARQQYTTEIEKLRGLAIEMLNGKELKTIGANVGVGTAEQKPALVRQDTTGDAPPTQPNKGPSPNR